MKYVSLATLVLAAALLLMRLPILRRTTLLGPGLWLLAALTALSGACGLRWSSQHPLVMVVEYLAAALTICPLVSVLGAKRPQHRAWHFVVAALYLVLILPAADALVFFRSDGIELHLVRRIFLVILVGIGMANYLGTRFCFSAMLFAAGQACLFASSMLPASRFSMNVGFNPGYVLIGLAIALVGLDLPRRRSPPSGPTRAWLDFRDAFGAAWSLRVADRMNRASEKLGWGVRLHWSGFVAERDSRAVPRLGAAAERSFRMLLRRFVSPP